MIREMIQAREAATLSPYAVLSSQSKGRARAEEPCEMRTDFMRDRDRILHSKSFRRLKHKTQVFLAPEGDHFRERLTHTLEVSQLSRTVARALRLNEDLTEAIALGHDLGHTPFGHAGERALDGVMKQFGRHFRHNEQGVRVVDVLEDDGAGLNLTWEVRDGILNHGTASHPATLEGQAVRFCDKFAYIHHDMDDALRAGVLTEEDIPAPLQQILGHTVKERLNTMIEDVIATSLNRPEVTMSKEVMEAVWDLRKFMFAKVYTSPIVKSEEKKAEDMLRLLFEYYLEHWMELPREYVVLCLEHDHTKEVEVCDYIAGMTDGYATKRFEDLFVPSGWKG